MRHFSIRRIPGEIPMTTMADLAFLIIVFFMLTSVFSSNKGIDYMLGDGEEDSSSPIVIEITQSGNVIFDGRLYGLREMAAFSENLIQAGQNKTVRQAIILPADGCSYGDAIRIMDVLKQHQFDFAMALGDMRDFFR